MTPKIIRYQQIRYHYLKKIMLSKDMIKKSLVPIYLLEINMRPLHGNFTGIPAYLAVFQKIITF
jgi:hypothetical protein